MERNKYKETGRNFQEGSNRMRVAATQRAPTVAASDDGDEFIEDSPSVTRCLVNGSYHRRQGVVEWKRDKVE